MTIDELIAQIKGKQAPAPPEALAALEALLGARLPEDYRGFLLRCNGGYLGGRYWFRGPRPDGEAADVSLHHVLGFRTESHFSLRKTHEMVGEYLPRELLAIADDPFGNQVCIGVHGEWRGRVCFWDHENCPDPGAWDGSAAQAGNVTVVANSFAAFVAGLAELDDDEDDGG